MLDKVKNVALRAIASDMKTTPIKEIGKKADMEPLELRRTFKVLIQTEKIWRLLGHPLSNKLTAPTTNRLNRVSTIRPGTSGEHKKTFCPNFKAETSALQTAVAHIA